MCLIDRQISAEACRRTGGGDVCEMRLPLPVREALRLTRTTHPDREITCITFHSEENGHETLRLGPPCCTELHARDVVVLSVEITETSADAVRTWSHRLVARASSNAATRAKGGTSE